MHQLLDSRSAIYDQFQNSSALSTLNGDDFAAYYTSMYLIQDTGEAVSAHMEADFAANPMSAYIEFWGVMQAIFIQQDAIGELHSIVVGGRPNVQPASAWVRLRDVRNACAGHPANRTRGVPATQRAFMGRSFGNYGRITYEVWDARGVVAHPVFNLRQLIQDYDSEAAAVLRTILAAMSVKWP
jgi:hypothetical protein